MSIRVKVPLLIFCAFLFNVLFIGMYYNMSLSHTIASKQRENQALLDQTAHQIRQDLQAKIQLLNKDSSLWSQEALERFKETYTYDLVLKDISGKIIYRTEASQGVYFTLRSQIILEERGQIYVLEVIRHIPLGFLSTFDFVNDLFITEFIIISIVMLILSLVIHVNSIRPIMALQKDIQQYATGKPPKSSQRKDEIGMLQNDFCQLTASLEAGKANQTRIIASISHDIKTPLTSVLGYSERLKKEDLTEERRSRYIQTIHNKAERIKALIDEFDDYISFQIEPVLRKTQIHLLSFVKHIEEEYTEELGALGIDLKIECHCKDYEIPMDYPKINRVIGNIISNSIRFMKTGEKWIAITIEMENESLIVEIADNGMGVPIEMFTQLFEPFTTSDVSRNVAGLGLSICKSIVVSHGGEIGAMNNDFGGLTIRFELPV